MKKYSWYTSSVPKKRFIKIILCMKLTIFLMVAFCLQLAANVHSQSITMQMQNTSLKKIFLEIEKKSIYSVIFNDDAIPKEKVFSVNASNEDVRDILDNLLSSTSLTYKIQNTLLVITSKTAVQARTITGRITDSKNQALIGVSVSIKGTSKGAATDENGNYRISVDDDNSILVFSYLGFKTIEKSVGSGSVINVTMIEDNEALNEVIVIGYGGVRKSDLTGSVVSLKSKELTAYPAAGVQQALQGRAAGVLVQSNNGNPGGSFKIRIRGGTSVNASSDPLFVVDGFAGGILPPPEDIESMEILKDASATAIYGSRGANGVILISTKRGKSGKTSIDLNSSYSGQEEINRLQLLNGSEFASYIREINPAYVSANQNTDWQDLIFRQGDIKNTQLSISGGSEAIKYYVSGALFDQSGIIKNSSFQRFSVTSNLDFSATKWLKMGLNLFARSSENIGVRTQENSGGSTGTGVVSGAFKFGPDQPVLRPDGTYSIAVIGDPHDNPVAVVNDLQSENKGSLYQYNFYADFDFLKNLKFKTTFGAFSNSERQGNFTPTTLNGGRNVGGDASVDSDLRNSFINENFLTYTKEFAKKHTISVLGGFSYQKFINEESGARSQSFLSNSVSFRNLGGGAIFLAGNSSLSESQLASYYGRFNYNFSDRYLLTVNTRYDGSSNFSMNHKWAFFPSAALAWNMHNEKFMQNIPLISSFKWRVSYGLTGNQAIGPYQTLARFSSVFTVVNNSPANAVRPTTIANNDLKWETTAQGNYGVDIGFLKNRINFTADYYKSITSDLLFSVPLPQYSGYSSQTKNIGKIENKGLELSLGSKNIVGKFNWSTDFNISFNRNKVLELPNGNDIIYANAPGHMIGIGGTAQVLRVGQPVGSFFGWIYDGVYQTGATFKPGGGFEQAAGGENFRDFSGKRDANGKKLDEPDGLLNNDDRTIIGDPNPDFIFGLTNDFSYKNFDLNVFVQGSQGNDVLSYTLLELETISGINNATTEALKRWTPTNTNTNVPRAFAGRPQRVSTRWIFDGSYVRLKNVAFGYNFPTSITQKLSMQRLRIYVSAQNLLTSTNYRGYDPEVNYRNSNLNAGVDYGSYPNAKSITAGINVGF